ncbi:MAG: HisA/HisF-related TIM barrel protein [Arenimonas sp.]
MSFIVYPAIDIRAGRVVRLRQGDFSRETRYEDDPLAIISRYADAGAQWLHLVDLDAARGGGYSLQPLLEQLRRRTGLRIQTGGGLRCDADIEAALAAGAERVVIGSVAVAQPQRVIAWLRRFGADRVVVALDARRDAAGCWRLPVQGWTADSGRDLREVLAGYADSGLAHVLCTDIERDGMLTGTNTALYAELLRLWPQMRLQASGGARSRHDIDGARDAGCAGIVLGKALLDGRIVLRDLFEASPC